MEGNRALLSEKNWLMSNDTREFEKVRTKNQYPLAFLALEAERDGHEFIPQAKEKGARIFVVAHAKRTGLQKYFSEGERTNYLWIFCQDTLFFLGNIARKSREFLPGKFIGITGTNGKTSFKEILKGLLADEVFASDKNYNNYIGLPFSLLQVPLGSDPALLKKEKDESGGDGKSPAFVILEMGMNHAGEIKYLSEIARPDISAITSIGPGHLEFLGSVENVARAKAEIFAGMAPGAVLFLHGDSPYVALISHLARERQIKVQTFGLEKKNDFFPEKVQLHSDHATFTFLGTDFILPLVGAHQVSNSVGALAIAHFIGKKLPELREKLALALIPGGRLHVAIRGGVQFFLDYYNANPGSMLAGMQSVAGVRNQIPGARRVIWILGDMKELGSAGLAYHRDLGASLKTISENEDRIFLLGENAHFYNEGWLLAGGAPEMVHVFGPDQKERLKIELREFIREGDLVFIKGSRSMKMETLVDL
jgi:UDP-N-acetylmuramoyl-tripeptide--D-alanyl-D-alanine ligase